MKKTLVFLAVALATLAVLSACRSPLGESSLTTAVTIAVGGVLPPSRSVASGPGSRVLVPSTVSVRVTASWDGGTPFTQTVPVSGGQATIRRLPLGVTIELYFETLDAAGTVLTVGTLSLEPLSAGSNEAPSVTLKPSASMTVIELDELTTGDPRATSVEEGTVNYYSFIAGDGLDGEYQVLFDTGRAQWAWLKVYDEQWKELPVICSDPEQGWAVVHLLATQQVYVAISNTVSSLGYPAGSLSGTLIVRPAQFYATDGSEVGGTSANPLDLTVQPTAGSSVFLSEGIYATSGSLTLSGDYRLYGGFKKDDWSVRDADTYISALQASGSGFSTMLRINDGAQTSNYALDGLSITGSYPGGNAPTIYALLLTATGNGVVSNCIISGNDDETVSADGGLTSSGLCIQDSSPEISGCRISGGVCNTSGGDSSTRAIMVYGLTHTTAPYIHDCDIDGGRASVDSESYASSRGVHVWWSGAIPSARVARCAIWGGVTYSPYGSASSIGIGFANSSESSVYVVSSRLSGGKAISDYSSASTAGVQLEDAPVSSYIVGCSVDGGVATGGSHTSAAVNVMHADVSYSVVASCLLFAPMAELISSSEFTVGLYDYSDTHGLERLAGNAFLSCGAVWIFETTAHSIVAGFPASTIQNNSDAMISRAASLELRSYAAPATFDAFLAQDWRPASGALVAGTSSGELASDNGITAAMLEMYPAFGLDLAGNPRPTTGPWKRGAYE